MRATNQTAFRDIPHSPLKPGSQVEQEHPALLWALQRARHIELGDEEAEDIHPRAGTDARHPLPCSVREGRPIELRPGDARVDEPQHFDRNRAVVDLAIEQTGPGPSDFAVEDEDPAADQTVILGAAAHGVWRAVPGPE